MATKFSRGVIGPRRLSNPSPHHTAAATRGGRDAMRKINKRFKEIVDALENATADALLYGVQPILDKADVYVPKETEALRESRYVEQFVRGGKQHLELGYGHVGARGTNRLKPFFYAAIVHEDPRLKHKSPTRYKYLQAAMQEHLHEIKPRVAQFLKGIIR